MQDWQTLCCGIWKCRRDKKHREHNLCRQNAALCVGIRVVVVVLFGTVVLNKIVPFLFQIMGIDPDRQETIGYKIHCDRGLWAQYFGGCVRQKGSFDGHNLRNTVHNLGHNHKLLYLCPEVVIAKVTLRSCATGGEQMTGWLEMPQNLKRASIMG